MKKNGKLFLLFCIATALLLPACVPNDFKQMVIARHEEELQQPVRPISTGLLIFPNPKLAAKAAEEDDIKKERIEALARRTREMMEKFEMTAATFAVGSANLTASARADIQAMAEKIKQYKYNSITIEGHTDSTGSASLNMRLSKERARAVYNEFARHGIDRQRMRYIGFGSELPIDTNATAAGRANNRRVEIFVE
ncbi:MAG: OmpA family protein [Endomicrobia bacterium]|nr:OmpA family protein [Bacillota bacterium]MCL1971945.1 OmpA family protein [Endomicrobiia bacterium]